MLPSTKIKGINFSKRSSSEIEVLAINDIALWKNNFAGVLFVKKKLSGIKRGQGLGVGIQRENMCKCTHLGGTPQL